MPGPNRSNSILSSLNSLTTSESTKASLFEVLKKPMLVRTIFTKALLNKWETFCERAEDVRHARRQYSMGSKPKRKLLVISISKYPEHMKPLEGPKSDWKILGIIGNMTSFDVDILSDSLPPDYPYASKKYPSAENIERHLKALVEGNTKGDEFVVAYSGHCSAQAGLMMADGKTFISPESLHAWLVKPLTMGSRLWGFFDCCESSNLLCLPYKTVYDEKQGFRYGAFTNKTVVSRAKEGEGTVIAIGSSAGTSGEVDLADSPGQLVRSGLLTFQIYKFLLVLKGSDPKLSKFLPFIEEHFAERNQIAQVAASEAALLSEHTITLLQPLD